MIYLILTQAFLNFNSTENRKETTRLILEESVLKTF